MTIKTHLWTSPHGRYGGADFEVERVTGTGTLRLSYGDDQFPPEAHAALAELARGLGAYATQPDEERGPLPSAVFRVTKLNGDYSASDLSVFATAGCFAASDFHKRIHAETQVA